MQPLVALTGSDVLAEIGEANGFGNLDDALNRARQILALPTHTPPRTSSRPFSANVDRSRPDQRPPATIRTTATRAHNTPTHCQPLRRSPNTERASNTVAAGYSDDSVTTRLREPICAASM